MGGWVWPFLNHNMLQCCYTVLHIGTRHIGESSHRSWVKKQWSHIEERSHAVHSSSVKAHWAQCTLTSVTTVLQSKSISHTLTSIAAVYSSVTMGAVATIFRSNYGRKPFTFVWGTLGNKISKHDPFQRDVGVNNHHHMKISVQRPYYVQTCTTRICVHACFGCEKWCIL